MSGNITSFQSVIQLVSGTNLAIFALPQLGQNTLATEGKRWDHALDLAKVKASPALVQVLQAWSEYHNAWEQLTRANGDIRAVALAVSAVSAAYLLGMSEYDGGSANIYTGLVIVAGVLPSLALIARHAGALRLVRTYSNKRRSIKI